MSLIFSNLVVIKTLSSNHRMYNLYAKFVKIPVGGINLVHT